ncbi:hypothetical protein GGQ97_001550 [Sphingomonas kaistensis]|uniref:GIY-YIG catalytic domain-containing protein n=1 Tax=Sphingomonas kaistensis TaxID=298708 RepID=A0A7X5Y5Z5_9SPHN|nr:hypothetical protein [Sphingomonas kaistensis]
MPDRPRKQKWCWTGAQELTSRFDEIEFSPAARSAGRRWSGRSLCCARGRMVDKPSVAGLGAVLEQLLQTPQTTTHAIPRGPGFYAWWCQKQHLEDTSVPLPYEQRPPTPAEWSLLYVGISPSGPASTLDVSSRVARNHVGGNIGSSTFRQTLAVLLVAKLRLQPRTGSDRARLTDEKPPSDWLKQSCGLTYALVADPWLLEPAVISELAPPLNISHGCHPYAQVAKRTRMELRRACGL